MSFLQPWLLAALPLVALPIIIHLINQRRYQTVNWAAMMFLLAANRMSRGYARLRQWLIMAFRMLAIAALVCAISRPLASGWLGLTAGTSPDTTIIILDRSPSMQQSGAGGVSKLDSGRQQLARTLATLGSTRWVLIENTSDKPHELKSPDVLAGLPSTEPTSASSDLPAMLQSAHDYMKTNKSGRTEIWICSDVRQNDWNPESARWQTLRDAFRQFPQGVRFNLLAYADTARGNASVRVTQAQRRQLGDVAELLVSLKITREGGEKRATIPITFEIDGARSEVTVEMEGNEYELVEHRTPLESGHDRGWGRVTIPADANLADNDFYFAFDKPVPRHAIIVADDLPAARPLELATTIPPDPAVQCSAQIVAADQLTGVAWEEISLLLWQGPLPEGAAADQVRAFVNSGGHAIFFPPNARSERELFGVRWESWLDAPEELVIESWRGDQDLLAHTQSGAALPVGQIEVRRYSTLAGETTALATLRGGAPLLARATTEHGGAYFCATTPAPGDSSLATNGVVFYVLVQRALAGGAAGLQNTRQLIAGDPPHDDPATWQRLAGANEGISTEYQFHRGVYADGERLVAVNRASEEDRAATLDNARVAGLFKGLDFVRVDDRAGSLSGLIQEIWRLFLGSTIVALIVEAALCLPRRAQAAGGAP